MTMAVEVRILRPNDMPRSCRDASGRVQDLVSDEERGAALGPDVAPPDAGAEDLQMYGPGLRRRVPLGEAAGRAMSARLICARCGVSDLTVACTTTRDGRRWPATCSGCAARAAAKAERIRAVERVEAAS